MIDTAPDATTIDATCARFPRMHPKSCDFSYFLTLLVGCLKIVALAAAAVMFARLATAEDVKQPELQISKARVGIANRVKVAHWTPVEIETGSLTWPEGAKLEVTAPDNDGVPTIASSTVESSPTPNADRVETVFTNVGKLGASLEISLKKDDSQSESRTLRSGGSPMADRFIELPTSVDLLLFLGPMSQSFLDAQTRRSAANDQLVRTAVRVDVVEELPDAWFGYDSVDVAILTAGDDGPFNEFCARLAADEEHIAAFVRWIELGGRLVVFCGGQKPEEIFGEGKRLAALLPGRLIDVSRLPETGRLEHFSGSEAPVGLRGARQAISVPRIVEVDGDVEVYEGRQASDLPLVVRAPRGFGEITFVAIDPTKPPFDSWPARNAFVEAVLRPYVKDVGSASTAQTLVTRGYFDLSGALRQTLGRTFVGVAPIAFSLVALFAIVYLLVLGPLDYFLIRKWLQRSWVAWITFPIIVLLFTGLTLGLAERRHGSAKARVNRLELVDIDVASKQARGTVWSAVFSPHATKLDVGIEAETLTDTRQVVESLIHSWALPGSGIGGTQSGGMDLATPEAYRYGEKYDKLMGVPILTSGSKSLLTRWTAETGDIVSAELVDDQGMVTGTIVNRTGRSFRNVRLYYAEWGYRLGTLADGARIDIGKELSPPSFKTLVTQDSFSTDAGSQSAERVFNAERASLREILNVMMFYDAVGGFGFAQLDNQLQGYCDLSRFPSLGRALLVADVKTPGSRLVDATTGEAIGEQNSAGVVYRFVLPVGKGE